MNPPATPEHHVKISSVIYLQLFIFARQDPNKSTANSLRDMNIPEDINPFDVANDHPAAHPRLTYAAVDRWIWAADVTFTVVDARLAKVWELCLLPGNRTVKIPGN
jgi:hypothetical protein